jgi:hypothetical protein
MAASDRTISSVSNQLRKCNICEQTIYPFSKHKLPKSFTSVLKKLLSHTQTVEVYEMIEKIIADPSSQSGVLFICCRHLLSHSKRIQGEGSWLSAVNSTLIRPDLVGNAFTSCKNSSNELGRKTRSRTQESESQTFIPTYRTKRIIFAEMKAKEQAELKVIAREKKEKRAAKKQRSLPPVTRSNNKAILELLQTVEEDQAQDQFGACKDHIEELLKRLTTTTEDLRELSQGLLFLTKSLTCRLQQLSEEKNQIQAELDLFQKETAKRETENEAKLVQAQHDSHFFFFFFFFFCFCFFNLRCAVWSFSGTEYRR